MAHILLTLWCTGDMIKLLGALKCQTSLRQIVGTFAGSRQKSQVYFHGGKYKAGDLGDSDPNYLELVSQPAIPFMT